jgi:hypothetical protein
MSKGDKMKIKLFTILALIPLLCISLSTGCIFDSSKVVLSGENIVSQSEADSVALYWMKDSVSRLPSWGEAELSSPVTYYYVADTSLAIAYEYTVLNNGESVGHIIVSACEDLTPVLEFGEGIASSSYIDNAREAATEAGYITDNENPLILYWGAATYSVQFGDEMKKDGVAIHLPTGMLEKVPHQMRTQIDKEQARASWDRLRQNIADNSIE